MRRGEDNRRPIRPGEGISGGAQAQDLDALVLIFIRDVGVSAQDAQYPVFEARRRDDLPELVDLVSDEVVQPAAADRLDVLVADDYRRQFGLQRHGEEDACLA